LDSENLTFSVSGTSGKSGSIFNHVVNLANLSDTTEYFYRVVSADSNNNIANSEVKSFTTTDCDAEVPTSYAKIQDALDEAISGEKICVLAGSYEENITIDGKDVVLSGASWENTSISASYSSSTITLKNLSSSAIIEGFTISGAGNGSYGILVDNSSAVVRNNHIKDNSAGIRVFGKSMPDINRNVFTGNNSGGAIVHNGTGGGYTIKHNTFANNGSNGGVATILLEGPFPTTPVVIIDNIFTGGVVGVHESIEITNFMLTNNLFYNYSETYLKKIETVYNTVSAINTLTNASKNDTGDPALKADYRLQSNSPAIKAASDEISNIGAY